MFLKSKVEELNEFATTTQLEKTLHIKKKVSWLHEIINDYKVCNEARYDGINKFVKTKIGKGFLNKVSDKRKLDKLRITDNNIEGPRGIMKIGQQVFKKGLKLFYSKRYDYEKGMYKLGDLKDFINYEDFLKSGIYKDYKITVDKDITEKEFDKIMVMEYTKVIS